MIVIRKSYMCITVKETNIEAILAVMNTTELVVEIRPEKKIQARSGFRFIDHDFHWFARVVKEATSIRKTSS